MSTAIPQGLLPHTVVQVRPSKTNDPYGSEVYDYGDAAVRTPITAWLQQDSRSRTQPDGRDIQDQGWLLITNHADTLPLDRYEWQEITFETAGPPNPVFTPRGQHHREVQLRIITG